MDEAVRNDLQFELNPELDPEKLREEFRPSGRLRIPCFLKRSSAEALYQHLVHSVQWRTFLVANEQLLGTPPGEPVDVDQQDEKEILERAYNGARGGGFACVFDADRLFPEDEFGYPENTASIQVARSDSALATLEGFMNSSPQLELVRKITGTSGIDRLIIQATRFRPGHFVGFNAGTWSADKTRKRRAACCLNLTPEWKPEWGGTQDFRSAEQGIAQSFIPCFNSFDLYEFPMGYWITPVAPFINGPRFSIEGRLYVK